MWIDIYEPGGPIQYNVWVPFTPAQELNIFQQVFINTFGFNVNLVPSSLNGVFVQELTNFGVQNENTVTLLTSGFYNPNYASDKPLEDICAWNDIQRKTATKSIVTCQLTGLALITIPANKQVISIYGDIFYAESDIVLDSSGNGSGVFLSVNTGPINCDANAINRILQPVSGWDIVNNSSDGVQGLATQTNSSLRFERQYNLGINSTGSLTSLNSKLGTTQNIIDFIVINNSTDTPFVSRGVTVPVGGIYISVYAPLLDSTPETIGFIIADKNSSGTQMYTTGTNTKTYTYTDPTYFFTIPVTWDEPDACPIQVDLSYVNDPLLPADIENQIKDLIINNFNNGSTNVTNGRATFPPVNMRTAFYVAQLTAGIENLGVVVLSQTMQTVTSGSPVQSLLLDVVGTTGTTGKPTINSANINLTPV